MDEERVLEAEALGIPDDAPGGAKNAILGCPKIQAVSNIGHCPKRGRPAVLNVPADEVLRLSGEGLSIREIAGRMRLSRSTVHRTLREGRMPHF
jgi:predicted DNA-binding protein (UPF0251 family)